MSETTCTVCGGRLHEAEEIKIVSEGIIYNFCSSEHKKEFNRRPDNYK